MKFGFADLRIAVVSLGLTATACPFGDCWGSLSMTVRVADDVLLPEDGTVNVVTVTRIYETDVTGTTPEGLPIGPAADDAVSRGFEFDRDKREGTFVTDLLDPYPTWIYAYVDLDGDLRLDDGEPFGTFETNPLDADCEDYSGTIVIQRAK